MGDHGVNVSGFVHLVAAIVVKSGAYASFMGDKPPVYRRAERSLQAGSYEGLAIMYPDGRCPGGNGLLELSQ